MYVTVSNPKKRRKPSLTNADRKLKSENHWKERRCKLVNGMCKAYLCVDDQGSQPGETLQQTKTQTLIKTLRQRGLAVWGGDIVDCLPSNSSNIRKGSKFLNPGLQIKNPFQSRKIYNIRKQCLMKKQ